LPNDKTFYATASVSIFYDCVIFLLPIPILLQLQINTRRKAALIGMFVLGLFTTICSIMRMIQIITISKTGNSTQLVLWGTIEMNVGVSINNSDHVPHKGLTTVSDRTMLHPNTNTSLHLLPREIHICCTIRLRIQIRSIRWRALQQSFYECTQVRTEIKDNRYKLRAVEG
jgi:hypothetical protein